MDEFSKERSAKLVKTRAYMPTRYAHVTLARDHVQLRSANHQNHQYSARPTTIATNIKIILEYTSFIELIKGRGAFI